MELKKAKSRRASRSLEVPGILLRHSPQVYLAAIPGKWLVNHSTPSWRAKNPKKGFQRIVKEHRAKEIAATVLDQQRTFPNAITLATTVERFVVSGPTLRLPKSAKFLVVDGQHRLWAQRFSAVEGIYPCIIHMGRNEREMAELFLEINDNQRRVPSSLRWDLVRLVKSDDHATTMTADIVYELTERRNSPLRDDIDLTGENKDMKIKQGSLAPEIRTVLKRELKRHGADIEFEDYLSLFIRFFVAIRSLDPEGWGVPGSTFYRARILRALIRVLSDMLAKTDVNTLTTKKMYSMLSRIDKDTLSEEEVRRSQGAAGVQHLYLQMKKQALKG